MKLTSPSQVAALLGQLQFKPSKVLGQNFLIDQNILDLLLFLAELRPDDVVLEIGPGLGVVTEALLERVRSVTAVEKDRRLCAYLGQRLGEHANLTLICADAVETDIAALLSSGVTKVVSNLPYSVGSRILVDIVAAAARPELVLIMVQKDVARRLAALPGNKDYGTLSLYAQLDYDVHIEKEVSASCFLPAPEIRSCIVRMRRRPAPLVPLDDPGSFRALVKWAFSYRRKQISTLLHRPPAPCPLTTGCADDALAQAGIDPAARPGDISLAQWAELSNALGRATP